MGANSKRIKNGTTGGKIKRIQNGTTGGKNQTHQNGTTGGSINGTTGAAPNTSEWSLLRLPQSGSQELLEHVRIL